MGCVACLTQAPKGMWFWRRDGKHLIANWFCGFDCIPSVWRREFHRA